MHLTVGKDAYKSICRFWKLLKNNNNNLKVRNISENIIPKHQQPYPMVLDDIPNMLLQFQGLHGTYPLLQHQAFSHPIHIKAKRRWGRKGGGDVYKSLKNKIFHTLILIYDARTKPYYRWKENNCYPADISKFFE